MLRYLDRLEEILIATLIAAATLLIFTSVVHRYSLGILADGIGFGRAHNLPWLSSSAKTAYMGLRSVNLIWAQELCIYMFVWMAKFGAAYGVRTGIHVGVDVLINKLNDRYRKVFVLFGLGCGALFTGIIATLGARFVMDMYHTSAISADMELPMWMVYLAIPCGSSLMCFRFLQVAWTYAQTGQLPHRDHTHVDGIEPDDMTIMEAEERAGQLPRPNDTQPPAN